MSRRRPEPLDQHLAAWMRGDHPALDAATQAMPAELRAVLMLHYRQTGPLKARRMTFTGSRALYWQRWAAARAWVAGYLAAHGEAAGDAHGRAASGQPPEV